MGSIGRVCPTADSDARCIVRCSTVAADVAGLRKTVLDPHVASLTTEPVRGSVFLRVCYGQCKDWYYELFVSRCDDVCRLLWTLPSLRETLRLDVQPVHATFRFNSRYFSMLRLVRRTPGTGTVRNIAAKLKTAAYTSVFRRPLVIRPKQPVFSFSFDDVLLSAVENGVPILDNLGVSGSFYVAADLAINSFRKLGSLEVEQTFASLDTLKQLHRSGHHIGCHTYSH